MHTTFPAEQELLKLSVGSASKGNQFKYISKDKNWYYKGNLFYQNKYWRNDLVEVIASTLSDIGFNCNNTQVLNQYSVERFGIHGVFSPNFAREGEEFIPFERLLHTYNFDITLNKGLDTFLQIADAYYTLCDIDATDFLLTQALLDFLVGNEDRHTNNFGILYKDGEYSLHPCFDFGLGMFEHDRIYEDYKFRDKLSIMQFKTFGLNQYSLILELRKRYPDFFTEISKLQVKPSDFKFPSTDGETYLRNACIKLEVSICND